MEQLCKDYMEYWDRIKEILIHIIFKEYGSPWLDRIGYITYVLNKAEFIKVDENPEYHLTLTFKDRIPMEDVMDLEWVN